MDEFDATVLLIQRTRRARPGWVLNTEDRSGIVNLCQLIEEMPRAVELAATWVKLLSPGEIAAEIQHRLDFLSTQMRDLPDRHRSMRAVFGDSWR